MTDDLRPSDLSSPATNGASGDSSSALSVGSNGGAKAIDASDEKAQSTVAFLIAETNRLAEENQRLKDKLALLDVEKRLALLEPLHRIGGIASAWCTFAWASWESQADD
jgi:hypothetical protein